VLGIFLLASSRLEAIAGVAHKETLGCCRILAAKDKVLAVRARRSRTNVHWAMRHSPRRRVATPSATRLLGQA